MGVFDVHDFVADVVGGFDDEYEGIRRLHMQQIMDTVDDPNEKIAYLRSCVIGTLVCRSRWRRG